MQALNIAVFGLSITSSWGNGHATTFRSLTKALHRRGHQVTFFERDVPWYASNRDFPKPPFCETILYSSLDEVAKRQADWADADLIIIGSYVPQARQLLETIREGNPACLAFYDIDTPVTLAKLERGDFEYLSPEMIPQFDLYLSFTGGPSLERLEKTWGARRARPLYCSVDPELYHPEPRTSQQLRCTLGYLGTYSDDRQPTLEKLLIEPAKRMPARKFAVAGAQYPKEINWPANVEHIEHIPPQRHREFYNSQRFTLNVTRANMIDAGFSPSVRLFEAGACGTPVISDHWEGLDHFFAIDEEILVARNSSEVIDYLNMDDSARRDIGERMRNSVLKHHTADHRARELEEYWRETLAPPLAAVQAYSSAQRNGFL